MDEAIANTFNGWYYHGFSGSVRQAVTAGAFSRRIAELVSTDDMLVEVGTDGGTLAHMFSVISDGRFDNAQSFELNGKRGLVSERVIPWLVPFTVDVVGPTASSVMEPCLVVGIASKTAMYQIIQGKVTARMNSLLFNHLEEQRLLAQHGTKYSGDIQTHSSSFVSVVPSTEFANLLSLEDFVVAYNRWSQTPSTRVRFAAALGSVMLMSSIQHNADIDAGDRFRDKRGRQAALDEYEAALKNALFH
jgi:hypothetical protein